jgi:hypothetical protein
LSRFVKIIILQIVLNLAFALNSFAHKPSDSYIFIRREGDSIFCDWEISLKDLDYAIDLDKNNDGKITWGELKAKHKDIEEYALPQFSFIVKGEKSSYGLVDHLVNKHSDGLYAVLRFKIDPPGKDKLPKTFDITYDFLFDIDPQHRGILTIRHKENTSTYIFSPENSTQHFNLNDSSKLKQLLDFIWQGIWHIWIGIDHILFLLSLLFASVLIREKNAWKEADSLKKVLIEIVKIISAFTIAHSITLSLAVLGIVSLPSAFVESVIAFSVFLAALNNIFPVVYGKKWLIAFLFGLIHGFGFASVLMELDLNKSSLVISLFGFNLGVELGQLAIVLIFTPIAFLLRKTSFYRSLILIFGSIVICVIAILWFIERAFNLSFLPF